ncbi:MAG: hypothetical protein DWI62_03095 [Chloroflexi bacterium]|nr:MAG: hypothetical protein DWI62_03095 [Chloroflexota bacterium]
MLMRTPAAVAAPGQRQRTLAVCAALVLLAFALRVAGVQRQDLWGDEAFSVRFSAQALPQIVRPGVETHPPLYHALLHYWMAAAGNRPLAVRYLSVLTGTLLVATCCNLGRSVFPRAVGVTTAAVASVSAFGIYYSQEARMYALAALLCALATLLVLRHQARPRQTERLWAWLLAVTLALFTHYYCALVWLAHLLLLAAKRSTRSRLWLGILPGAALAAWVLAQRVFLGERAGLRWQAWDWAGSRAIWLDAPRALLAGTTLPPAQAWLAYGLLAVAGWGVWRARHMRQRWLALCVLLPLLGAWLLAPVMPFFNVRFLIVALPALWVLLAAGVQAAPRGLRPLLLAAVLFVNLLGLYHYHFNSAFAKGGYGRLLATLRVQAQAGDGLLLAHSAQSALYEYYGPVALPLYKLAWDFPWTDARSPALLDTAANAHTRLWLLSFGDAQAYDPQRSFQQGLSQRAFLAWHGDFTDATLDLFVRGDTQPNQPRSASFAGQLLLDAFGLSATRLPAGSSLQVATRWQALAAPAADYTLFTHLLGADGSLIAQVDGQPQGGLQPTGSWPVGAQFTERVALQLPRTLQPGSYAVQVGWYRLDTLERLVVDGSGGLQNSVELGSVVVTAP